MGGSLVDLDKSGIAFQQIKVWQGPSQGWVMQQVQPSEEITVGGSTTLGAGASIVFVNAAAPVTITLPNVILWMREPAYRPAVSFERSIWIKDSGYNASSFNITITPFAGQTIDGLPSFMIVTQGLLIRLYPLNNLTGWFVG